MEGEVIARVQVKRQRSNDPFDSFRERSVRLLFFGGGLQTSKCRQEPTRPGERTRIFGRRARRFLLGAVGCSTFETSIDKDKTKTNEAVTLRIKVTGKGTSTRMHRRSTSCLILNYTIRKNR